MKKLLLGIIFSMLIIPSATSMMAYADDDYANEEAEEFYEDFIEKGTKVKSPVYGVGVVDRVVDYKGKVVYTVIFEKAGKKFVKPKDIQKL